jgi:hypothetical protein
MNTWILNKATKLFAIVTYPTKLIPRKGFKKEIRIESLHELGAIGIVRRSLKLTKEETFDKFGGVREDALVSTRKDVAGLSLNLLGNKFIPKHIGYLANKDAGQEWDGSETYAQLWKKYIKWVTYRKSSVPVFFLLDDLHNQTFPYYRKKDKDVDKLLKALNIKSADEEDTVKLYGASVIKHVPVRLNYWHIEFKLLDIEAREKGNSSKITREKIKSSPIENTSSDILKQHWITQAAIFALNDILLHSAYDFLDYTSYKEIGSSYFLN